MTVSSFAGFQSWQCGLRVAYRGVATVFKVEAHTLIV